MTPLEGRSAVARFAGPYDAHTFCGACGAHRYHLPFGDDGRESFWDSGPCRKCAKGGRVVLIARRQTTGRWWQFWRRDWVTDEGYIAGPEAIREARSDA